MSSTKVVTGKVRFSYAHVFEPTSMNEGETPKYSTAILIPKKDKKTIAAIEAAVKAATEEGKSKKFGGKIPGNLKTPLRDGDEEKPDDETYAGHYFLSASSVRRPGVVDEDRNDIIDKDEFYSGCYGRASLNFYPYNFQNMSKGIAVGLNGVQKLEDGESLAGGRFNADEDFGDDDLM